MGFPAASDKLELQENKKMKIITSFIYGRREIIMEARCIVTDGGLVVPHSTSEKPAVIFFNGLNAWYDNGVLHRDFAPAQIMHAKPIVNGSGTFLGWERWATNGKIIPSEEVQEIMALHQLNPDWSTWTDSEKLVMRLAIS